MFKLNFNELWPIQLKLMPGSYGVEALGLDVVKPMICCEDPHLAFMPIFVLLATLQMLDLNLNLSVPHMDLLSSNTISVCDMCTFDIFSCSLHCISWIIEYILHLKVILISHIITSVRPILPMWESHVSFFCISLIMTSYISYDLK